MWIVKNLLSKCELYLQQRAVCMNCEFSLRNKSDWILSIDWSQYWLLKSIFKTLREKVGEIEKENVKGVVGGITAAVAQILSYVLCLRKQKYGNYCLFCRLDQRPTRCRHANTHTYIYLGILNAWHILLYLHDIYIAIWTIVIVFTSVCIRYHRSVALHKYKET